MDRQALRKVASELAKEHARHELKSGFLPAGLHIYYKETGEISYFKIRLKHQNGDKWIRPFHFEPQENIYVMREPEFNNNKPLYNLLELNKRPTEPVLICEGELCCDKALLLGILSTTSGSATSAKNTDWQPLAGRTIYIWPDNDSNGFKYAEEVTQTLIAIDCNVKIIVVKKLDIPDKGDIVDWLKANQDVTPSDVFSLPVDDSRDTGKTTENIDTLIRELANLSEIDYQRRRKDEAKQLKISVTVLDNLVKKQRHKINSSSSEIFSDIEPWHDPVDGKQLLDDLVILINCFMVFPSEHEAKALALYIIHTHCIDAAECSPILNISSPEKRCGKSTLLSVLQRLVNRPLTASSISPAAVYRSIEKWQPTLMIDEADTFMRDNEEMRGVINSGHTRDSAYVIRCIGDDHEPSRFNTWCPKVIAGIGHLPETIEDRSIIIRLRRKLSTEKKDKLRDVPNAIFTELLRKCVRYTNDSISQLKNLRPVIPLELNDRAADNWAPLFAIAQLSGDNWLNYTTATAVHLCSTKQEPLSVSVELLQDIKHVFDSNNIERLYSNELLAHLCEESEAPWVTYNRGKPLTARQLANRLKEFKIHSKDMRIPPDKKNLKGYELKDFIDAFFRYIPSSPSDEEISATTRQHNDNAASKDSGLRDTQNMSREDNTSQSIPEAGCSVTADKNPSIKNKCEIVKCSECEHFIANKYGDKSGIGNCNLGIVGTKELIGNLPLFAHAERHCEKFSKLIK